MIKCSVLFIYLINLIKFKHTLHWIYLNSFSYYKIQSVFIYNPLASGFIIKRQVFRFAIILSLELFLIISSYNSDSIQVSGLTLTKGAFLND